MKFLTEICITETKSPPLGKDSTTMFTINYNYQGYQEVKQIILGEKNTPINVTLNKYNLAKDKLSLGIKVKHKSKMPVV